LVPYFTKIVGDPGCPKEWPKELHADEGYDSEAIR
jgi:hypothetical protein